jgi:hypothetical protein
MKLFLFTTLLFFIWCFSINANAACPILIEKVAASTINDYHYEDLDWFNRRLLETDIRDRLYNLNCIETAQVRYLSTIKQYRAGIVIMEIEVVIKGDGVTEIIPIDASNNIIRYPLE